MKVKLTLGDWSGDGHGQYDEFVYEVNKTVEEIRQAYKDSCVLTSLQFNHNNNYTCLKVHNGYGTEQHIWTDYGDYGISEFAVVKFIEVGLFEDENSYDEKYDGIQEELIMEFIKLSIPDLTWEEASFKRSELRNIKAINGWWNNDLNVQFGYGLYCD